MINLKRHCPILIIINLTPVSKQTKMNFPNVFILLITMNLTNTMELKRIKRYGIRIDDTGVISTPEPKDFYIKYRHMKVIRANTVNVIKS